MQILQIFCDESGTNRNDKVFVLAGLVSKPEKWARLATDWQRLLDEWGIPFFHMADFESDKGAFEGWKDLGVHNSRLQALLDLIRDNAVCSVAIALPHVAFQEVYGPNIKHDVKYIIAARTFFWYVSNFTPDGETLSVYKPAELDQFAYVFESGAAGAGKFQRIFQAYHRNEFTRWIFRLMASRLGDKRQYPQLQAADILAYECYRSWGRQHGGEVRPPRYPFVELSQIPHVYKNMTVETLKNGYGPIMKDIETLGLR